MARTGSAERNRLFRLFPGLGEVQINGLPLTELLQNSKIEPNTGMPRDRLSLTAHLNGEDPDIASIEVRNYRLRVHNDEALVPPHSLLDQLSFFLQHPNYRPGLRTPANVLIN